MGYTVGAVERRVGLQSVWVAVERYLLPSQQLDPTSPVFRHIGCLNTDRNQFIFCAVEC